MYFEHPNIMPNQIKYKTVNNIESKNKFYSHINYLKKKYKNTKPTISNQFPNFCQRITPKNCTHNKLSKKIKYIDVILHNANYSLYVLLYNNANKVFSTIKLIKSDTTSNALNNHRLLYNAIKHYCILEMDDQRLDIIQYINSIG